MYRVWLKYIKTRCTVISPELIREVEARMNRNYLPPSLIMQNTCSGPQSPPTCTTMVVTSIPTSPANTTVARRFGRACKLPTVQEVGEFLFLFFFSL